MPRLYPPHSAKCYLSKVHLTAASSTFIYRLTLPLRVIVTILNFTRIDLDSMLQADCDAVASTRLGQPVE